MFPFVGGFLQRSFVLDTSGSFLNVHGRARSSGQPGPCSFIKVKTVTYLLYIKKKKPLKVLKRNCINTD